MSSEDEGNYDMDQEEQDVWISFISKLEAIQKTSSDDIRHAFLEKHRMEIVLLSRWLNALKVTGGQAVIFHDPPTHCDQCGIDLSDNGFFVDGRIQKSILWSFMCLPCFSEKGAGVGYGVGQLFKISEPDENGDNHWFCIAGGDPDPLETNSNTGWADGST